MSERDEGEILALTVARLFFEGQLTKSEIAKRLGISRFRVARLIDDALARGLVTIHFAESPEIDAALGADIARRFGVSLCIVVKPDKGDGLEAAARVAARLLADLVQPGEVVGVAWGSTVAATVDALPPAATKEVRVVQLAGGTRRVEAESAPDAIATRMARKLGAVAHPIFAPAVVDSAAVRDALLREPEIASTVALFDRVTLALIGIGAFAASASSMPTAGVLRPDEVDAAVRAGAVADLVMHVVSAGGSLVRTSLEERAVAIAFDQLRRIPRVIAVAAGAGKAPAIAAALGTGIVSVLVTDAEAAQRMLDDHGAAVEPPSMS